jgi:hypothetical protein
MASVLLLVLLHLPPYRPRPDKVLSPAVTEAVGVAPEPPQSVLQLLESQADYYETRLRASEDKLAEFNSRHPECKQTEAAALQDEAAAIERVRTKLLTAKSRRSALDEPEAPALGPFGLGVIYVHHRYPEVEIASLQTELTAHQQKLESLRLESNCSPQVLAQYAQVSRDYQVNKAQFTALASKLEKLQPKPPRVPPGGL